MVGWTSSDGPWESLKGFGLGSRVTGQRLSDYYAGIEDSSGVRERGRGLKLFPAVEKLMEREIDLKGVIHGVR